MAKITHEEKIATQKRIQEAAREVFAEKGIQKASIREIAKKAGVGASTLYGYYPSKPHLFIETLLPTMESRDIMLNKLESIDITGIGIEEVTEILADTIFALPSSVLNIERSILREVHMVLFSVSSSDEIKIRMKRYLEEEIHIILHPFLRRLIDAGIIRVELNVEEFALLLTDLMRMVFLEYIILLVLSKEDAYTKLKNSIRLVLIGKI